MQRYIFDQETAFSNTPQIIPFGVTMVGPVIIEFGTDAQKKSFFLKFLIQNIGGVRAIQNLDQGLI